MGSNLMWDRNNQQNCVILHGAQKDKLGKTMQRTERQACTKGLFNISQCSSLRFWATIGSARLHLNLGMFGRQNQQMPREPTHLIFSHCFVYRPPSTGVPTCMFSCQLRYTISPY